MRRSPARRGQFAADRGGGDQARREVERLARQRQRALGVAFGALHGERGLQHRPPAVGGRLVEQPRLGVGLDGGERVRPIGAPRVVVEHGLRRPRQRRARIGAPRVVERGLRLAGAARLDMQPAQAQQMRVLARQHFIEGGDRAGAVAGELRRLRAQKLGQRFLAEIFVGLDGVAAGLARVAGADGDHAARQRRKTLFAPAGAAGVGERRGRAQHKAQNPPDGGDDDGEREHDPGRRDQRHFVFDAAPGQRDRAWNFREPGEAYRDEAERRQKRQQAQHAATLFLRRAEVRDRPLGERVGGLRRFQPRRARPSPSPPRRRGAPPGGSRPRRPRPARSPLASAAAMRDASTPASALGLSPTLRTFTSP